MTKQITKEELVELLENPDAKKIGEFATKHDCRLETWILLDEDKFWKVGIELSYNYGIIDNIFYLEEAESYEETVTKWRKKK